MKEKCSDEFLFDQIKKLLALRPLKTSEICQKLDENTKNVMAVLKANAYSFDFRMSSGTKVWQNI